MSDLVVSDLWQEIKTILQKHDAIPFNEEYLKDAEVCAESSVEAIENKVKDILLELKAKMAIAISRTESHDKLISIDELMQSIQTAIQNPHGDYVLNLLKSAGYDTKYPLEKKVILTSSTEKAVMEVKELYITKNSEVFSTYENIIKETQNRLAKARYDELAVFEGKRAKWNRGEAHIYKIGYFIFDFQVDKLADLIDEFNHLWLCQGGINSSNMVEGKFIPSYEVHKPRFLQLKLSDLPLEQLEKMMDEYMMILQTDNILTRGRTIDIAISKEYVDNYTGFTAEKHLEAMQFKRGWFLSLITKENLKQVDRGFYGYSKEGEGLVINRINGKYICRNSFPLKPKFYDLIEQKANEQ